jgi:predicted  nucleic acid-binding Zn-ribbon protein
MGHLHRNGPSGCHTGVEKAARDREVWRREVADLERQLDYARDEAQKAERRVTDAKEALGLSEQRLRAAKVRLDRKTSGLSG